MLAPERCIVPLADIDKELANRGEGRQCFWPAPYDKPEAGWGFVLDNLQTWNEAEQDQQPFPDKQYLADYAHEWIECRRLGRTLITEKCRRMVISWLARGLELHAMGLRKTDCVLAGEDLEAAAAHVWRLQFLYDGLRRRKEQEKDSEWDLPPCHTLAYKGPLLSSFALPNASSTRYQNGQAVGLQGAGTSIITLEEFSTYRYATKMLAQAKIITQGSPGSVGGFVNVILNASANPGWQSVKKAVLGR